MHKEKKKKCKGNKKVVIKNNFTYDDYERCLFERKYKLRRTNVIRSRKNKFYTETVKNIALSCDDNKRRFQEDGINTLTHGHHSLPDCMKMQRRVNLFYSRTIGVSSRGLSICKRVRWINRLSESWRDKSL